jgi:hypothetical protein
MEYCYIITFKPTGQMYLGSRSAKNADPTEFWNKNHQTAYFTSSKIIHKLIKIFGEDSFETNLILTFPMGGAYKHETMLLQEMNLKDDINWLNRSNNTRGVCNTAQGKIWIHNETNEIYIKENSKIPEGYVKGRLKSGRKKQGSKDHKWIFHPETNKNIHVHISKIEYYLKMGYIMGQSNGAMIRKWYNDGTQNIYLKEPSTDIKWKLGRIVDQSHQLILITDPNGIIHYGLDAFINYIRDNLNCRLKMGTHARLIISGKKSIITKRLYQNNKNLFDFYNLSSISVIGKCFTEIGFCFNKSQKF